MSLIVVGEAANQAMDGNVKRSWRSGFTGRKRVGRFTAKSSPSTIPPSCHSSDSLTLKPARHAIQVVGLCGHRACSNERQVSCGQRTLGPIWRRTSASRSGELTYPTVCRRPAFSVTAVRQSLPCMNREFAKRSLETSPYWPRAVRTQGHYVGSFKSAILRTAVQSGLMPHKRWTEFIFTDRERPRMAWARAMSSPCNQDRTKKAQHSPGLTPGEISCRKTAAIPEKFDSIPMP